MYTSGLVWTLEVTSKAGGHLQSPSIPFPNLRTVIKLHASALKGSSSNHSLHVFIVQRVRSKLATSLRTRQRQHICIPSPLRPSKFCTPARSHNRDHELLVTWPHLFHCPQNDPLIDATSPVLETPLSAFPPVIEMSATASSQSPAIVRSQSTSKPQSSYTSSSADSPSRARSTTTKATATRNVSSGLYRVERPQAPPTANQAALANVARKDQEDPNLARTTSTRRSSSQDRYYDSQPQTYRTNSGSNHQRTSSRPGSRRGSTDMAAPPPTVAANAGPAPAQGQSDGRPSSSTHPSARRRTTITTQTGTWLLGKTIGQGSMGKVKLGRNTETGEQVSIDQTVHVIQLTFSRSRSR